MDSELQVAGLPPVTKDWFEARKAQLSTATSTPNAAIWFDPLTKKKFQTQNTYQVGGSVECCRIRCLQVSTATSDLTVACMGCKHHKKKHMKQQIQVLLHYRSRAAAVT
jgi:hypothetical protein